MSKLTGIAFMVVNKVRNVLLPELESHDPIRAERLLFFVDKLLAEGWSEEVRELSITNGLWTPFGMEEMSRPMPSAGSVDPDSPLGRVVHPLADLRSLLYAQEGRDIRSTLFYTRRLMADVGRKMARPFKRTKADTMHRRWARAEGID
jgi:hypothetical protein